MKAPPHASDGLIKFNGFEFQKGTIKIENVRISRQMRHHNRFSINQQNSGLNSVINRDSSNHHILNRKVIPGEKNVSRNNVIINYIIKLNFYRFYLTVI